jgi:hypothetical protein
LPNRGSYYDDNKPPIEALAEKIPGVIASGERMLVIASGGRADDELQTKVIPSMPSKD